MIYKLIDDILKHREEVYSLWGKNKDDDYIFLGIFQMRSMRKMRQNQLL